MNNPPPGNPANLVLEELRTRLQFVAPIHKWEREKAKNDKVPRFVWVPRGGLVQAARAPARNPRHLAQFAFRIDVFCLGKDDEEAYRLAQAFLSAVELVARGRNYRALSVDVAQPSWLTRGVTWTLITELWLVVPEAALPESAGDPLTDNVLTTVTPTAVEQAAPSLSTPGDGVLEGSET